MNGRIVERWRIMRRDDAGYSLMEMAVTASIGLLLLAMVGALVIGGIKFSGVANGRLQAVGGQKLISQSLQIGLSQADWVSTPTTGTSQFVTAHVLTGTGSTLTWACQAWYWTSAGTGAMYTRSSSSTIAAPSGSMSGWTLLASGVSASGATPVLTGTSTSLTFKAQVAAPNSTSALVSSTVFLREPNSGGSACR